ncbi:outer membrane protein [Ruegeria halocynthiae]|nr:outer membrane beta-barrel protein [Ruegeria halocynthiae]
MRNTSVMISSVAAVMIAPGIATADDDWAGVYAGIHFGAADGDLSSGSAKLSDHSAVYGLQLGYNYSLANNWIVGSELSYSTAEFSAFGPSKDMDTTRLKLKAGYAVGAAMYYGVLGYSHIDLDGKNESGATYGLGVGYKATGSIVLNAELLRDGFDFESSGTDVDVDVTTLLFGVSYQF